MTATAYLISAGICSGAAAVGIAMQATVGDAAFPWDKVGSAGIAGAVVLVGGFFLRRESAIRSELAAQQLKRDQDHAVELRERDAVNRSIAKDFGDTATNLTKTFAESTAAADLRAQQREQRLLDVLERLPKTQT